jgi:hypothetical protein
MKTATLSIIILLAMTGFALAEELVLTWSQPRSVASTSDTGQGFSFVLSGSDMTGGAACQNAFRVSASDPFAAAQKGQVLSAKDRGKPVSVLFLPSSTACPVVVSQIKIGS